MRGTKRGPTRGAGEGTRTPNRLFTRQVLFGLNVALTRHDTVSILVGGALRAHQTRQTHERNGREVLTSAPVVQKTPSPIDQLAPVTPAQVEQARRACAVYAADAADLALLLEAVGIGPDWRDAWRGPVEG